MANPLDEDDAKKADDVDAAKAMPAESDAVAAPAVVKDDGDDAAPQLHHNDDQDDDTDSDADAMDKAAAPMEEKAAEPDIAKKPKIPCPNARA